MDLLQTTFLPARASGAGHFALGLFYGALLVMVLYNLVVAVSIRDRVHASYVVFIVTLGLTMFVWDDLHLNAVALGPVKLRVICLPVLNAVATVAGIQFTRLFLLTMPLSPRTDRILQIAMLITLGMLPLSWISPYLAIDAVGSLNVLIPVLLLMVGIRSRRDGHRPAGAWLIAVSPLLLAAVTQGVLDFVFDSGFTRYLLHAGAISMMVLFSRALTDRYNDSNRERRRMQTQNEELRIVSSIDPICGVWNRRRFEEELPTEWARAQRELRSVGIALVDVDHFKAYNDSYGHVMGDESLQAIAGALEKALKRPADRVARYGGEEFIALLPDTDAEGARQVGEELRRAIEDLEIPHRSSPTAKHVTVSVGVATTFPSSVSHGADLVRDADRALYHAKERGRNCVQVSSEVLQP